MADLAAIVGIEGQIVAVQGATVAVCQLDEGGVPVFVRTADGAVHQRLRACVFAGAHSVLPQAGIVHGIGRV